MRKLLPLLAAFVSLALLAPSPPAAAGETPAYIAIGDSLAFGVGATDPAAGGYVALTYDSLRTSERYRDRGLELLNLGVPGATSADLLLPGGQLEYALGEIRDRREDTSSSDDNVEIITVDIGGNDVLALGTEDSPCIADLLGEDCQQRFRVMLGQLKQNLTGVLERLRAEAPKADIVVLDLYSPLSGRGGAEDIIADFAIGEINAVTEEVASRPDLQVEFASVYPLFRGRAQQLVAADSVHPNDEGHAVMSEVVLAAIEGRAPDLPEELLTPLAVDGFSRSPLGRGGLEPIESWDDSDGSSLAVILAIAIPAALLGAGAVAGAYFVARGR